MKLLLDEQISPKVGEIVQGLEPVIDIQTIYDWKGGQFTSQPDDRILRAAAGEGMVLVTYDVRTIPPILVEFAIANEDHGGVVLVSAKSIPSHDFKRLAHALVRLVDRTGAQDWINRVDFLSWE